MKFLYYLTCVTYILLAFNTNQSEAIIEDVIDILHLTKGVIFGVLEAWEFVDAAHADESIEIPLLRQKEKRVLKRLNKVQMQIRATEQQHLHTAQWTIDSIRDEMHASFDLKLAMNQLNVIENSIEARSKTLERYTRDRALLENATLIQFAEWTTKPGENSIQHMMDTLHLLAVGSKDRRGSNKSLFSMVAKSLLVNYFYVLYKTSNYMKDNRRLEHKLLRPPT